MGKSLIVAAMLGFVGFVTSFGAHIVAVNLPTYAEQVGIGLAMIGLLIAAYDLAEIVAKPVFGFVADRRGMKQTMMFGIVLFVAASLLYLVLPPSFLLAVRFLQGVGAAALSAISLALVGAYFPANRGRAYGIYNAIKGAGYVLSPLIGGYLVVKTDFAAIFVAAAAAGLVALGLALALPREPAGAELDDDDDDFSVRSFLAVFRDRALLPWYGVIVVNMFFVGILFGFVPVRIHGLGYDALSSGVLIAIVSLSYLLVQPLAGSLADRIGVELTLRAGLALGAISIILVPFAAGPGLVAVSIAAGIGVGTVWTNTDTLMSRLARQGRLGQTMGAAGSFKELGDMAGPLLIGILSQAFGLTAGFVACGVAGLLALVFVWRATSAEPDRSGPA